MPRICANLTFLFKEYPFLERFDAAADAGFDGVEILFPYDDPAPEILRRMQATGLPLALINAPPPNYTGGPRGFAAVPEVKDRFRRDFGRVLRYAERLHPQHIHIMSGDVKGDAARDTFIENLAWAAAQAPDQSLTIEPLCGVALPDYYLNDFDLALEVIGCVNAPNLSLQFDTFHAQMLTGDAVATWHRCALHTRHVQIGDTPKRGAPGTGDVDFTAFFAALRDTGYDGWISAEYNPGNVTPPSLGWMKEV